jgi:hypothetical protein
MLSIACGWDLEEAFDADSLAKMVDRFMGSANAVFDKYIEEMTGQRKKN